MKYDTKYFLKCKIIRSEDRSNMHLILFHQNFILIYYAKQGGLLCKTIKKIFADVIFKTVFY